MIPSINARSETAKVITISIDGMHRSGYIFNFSPIHDTCQIFPSASPYDLPAFFGPPIIGEQGQSAWLSRSRVLLGQREPASPASAHRHPSQHGAAL